MESIVKQRMSSHGNPVVNMRRIAEAWSALLGYQLTAMDVARMMAALHLVRDATAPEVNPEHRQHAEGYLEIARLIDQGTRF